MPKFSPKFLQTLLFIPILFVLNLPFLVSPPKAQAAADVCSAHSLISDEATIDINPKKVFSGEVNTIDMKYYVIYKDRPKTGGFPIIKWEIWNTYPGADKPKPLGLGPGGNLTIDTAPQGSGKDTYLGIIVPYSGDYTMSGAGSLVGEYKFYFVNPRLDDGTDETTNIACNKTASYRVVPQPNATTPNLKTQSPFYKTRNDTCSNTALGFSSCPEIGDFVGGILQIVLGFVGGVAFLLLIYGGIRLVSSQGDQKALQEARGIITSAIVGLLFAIFSVFLLRLLGITILGLPI